MNFPQLSKVLQINHQTLALQLARPTFCAANECLPPKRDRAQSLCLLACFKVHDQLQGERCADLHRVACKDQFFRALVAEELKSMGVEDPELHGKFKGQVGSDVLEDMVGRFFAGIHAANGVVAPCPGTVSVIGGIMAQEVIKAVMHVHAPVSQWLMHHSLPPGPTSADAGSGFTRGASRYTSRVPYDPDVAEELRRMRVFVVGAGAIGCELLKNFALIGVGSGETSIASGTTEAPADLGRETAASKRTPGATKARKVVSRPRRSLWSTFGERRGGIIVTDMDVIERSNLNRQLLFR
jgi:ubiquitin-activating enzyme E1